jgi:hypothetical protein
MLWIQAVGLQLPNVDNGVLAIGQLHELSIVTSHHLRQQARTRPARPKITGTFTDVAGQKIRRDGGEAELAAWGRSRFLTVAVP